MTWLILPGNPAAARLWILGLEDADEHNRCLTPPDITRALALLQEGAADVLLAPDTAQCRLLLESLQAHPTPQPPYIVLDRWQGCLCDLTAAPGDARALAAKLFAMARSGCLPVLAALQLPSLTCLSRALLRTLDVPPGLRAMRFLPDMLALCAAHPALLADVTHRLYPLAARRNGLSAAAVERSLRLLIESTWNRTGAPALERFFGHSVDPERGKPTNKEFLARMQERILLAYRRLG